MIDKYSFGKIVIDGKIYTSDLKIKDGKVLADWWRKAGHHVCKADVADLLDSKPKVLVLGTGIPGLMKADSQLFAHLTLQDIELIEEPTSQAIITYNERLANGEKVAAAFHLTC